MNDTALLDEALELFTTKELDAARRRIEGKIRYSYKQRVILRHITRLIQHRVAWGQK